MLTLFAALERYIKTISILKKGYKQEFYRIRSIQRNQIAIRVLNSIRSYDIAYYRDTRLTEINPKTGRPISPSTVRLELSLLSHLFDIARIEWGVGDYNPVKDVRKPSPGPSRERRLTRREENQIYRFCKNYGNPELEVIVTIALETAMRQSEIITMDWANIDLRSRVVKLIHTKNGHARDVPLSLKARDSLISMGMNSRGRVFGYTSNGFKSVWRTMIQKIGIDDLHFHDLRHEAISRLFEAGNLNTMEVAAISGHKSMGMLKRYTHLRAQNLVKKLDGRKAKGQMYIVNKMLPYPAVMRVMPNQFQLSFPDIEGLVIQGACEKQLEIIAQHVLSSYIVESILKGKKLSHPDSHLKIISPQDKLLLIEPQTCSNSLVSLLCA